MRNLLLTISFAFGILVASSCDYHDTTTKQVRFKRQMERERNQDDEFKYIGNHRAIDVNFDDPEVENRIMID